MAVTFTWYGHSCGEIRTADGKTILLDPWFGNPRSPKPVDEVDACDLLLVSHGHFDHLGGDIGGLDQSNAITIARRTAPTWPTIHESDVWLSTMGLEGATVIGMNKGGSVEAAGVRVTMVRADHSSGDLVGGTQTPLALGEPVGFVIEPGEGPRVYFAGDTDVFGDMDIIRRLYAPEVALLPIGGHYTMGPKGAALAAKLLGVKRVVPVHYGTFPVLVGTPEALRDELPNAGAGSVEVLAPEVGGSVEL